MELEGYNIERGFIEGLHGTKREIRFLQDVVTGIIRQAGYREPIRLIGSRAQGKWISKSNFSEACGELPDQEQRYWYDFLNKAAHKHNYDLARIPRLLTDLPSTAPPEIAGFLTGREPPGSDFDLLLIRQLAGVEPFYYDVTYGTEQHVDILIFSELVSFPSEHSKLY